MRAKKSLGQNFLRDETVTRRIVDALDLEPAETVIEIGPGQGALTATLLDRADKVIAIEFDRDMVETLSRRFGSNDRLEIIARDALSVDLGNLLSDAIPAQTVKLVANLPYNISTPILQRLIEQRELFSTIVLMFQREVVERITATPGDKGRGFLSVLVEGAFTTEYLFDVPPGAFWPVPKVWSSVVRLRPKPAGLSDEPFFRRLISVSFAQKRKTILNNLRSYTGEAELVLSHAGIDPRRRAETLTHDEWIGLAKHFRQTEKAGTRA